MEITRRRLPMPISFVLLWFLSWSLPRVVGLGLECRNERNTCAELLESRYAGVNVSDCDVTGDVFYDYSINDTAVFQISASLLVNRSHLPIPNDFESEKSYYIFGYKECTQSTTSETCFIGAAMPAYGNMERISRNKDETQPPLDYGETCTFFGCFIYHVNSACFVNNITERSVTFLATCNGIEDDINNGNISVQFRNGYPGQYVEGTVVQITCEEGFVATLNGTSECQSDGNWSTPHLPFCKRVCPAMNNMTVEGGIVESNSSVAVVDITISVICHSNYTGGGRVICGEDGEWNASLPSCIPITCPIPMGIEYLSVTVDSPPTEEGYPINSTITVNCNFFQQSGVQIMCDSNGEWGGRNLTSCSPDTQALVAIVTPLALVALICMVGMAMAMFYKKYISHRNDMFRRLNLIYSIQSKKEELDPHYEPIDLQPKRRESIASSFFEMEQFYDSSLALSSYVAPKIEVQNSVMSQSLDNLAKQSESATNRLAITPYIQDSSSPKNRSCPSLYLEDKESVNPPTSTDSGIVFHFTESSSSSGGVTMTNCEIVNDSANPSVRLSSEVGSHYRFYPHFSSFTSTSTLNPETNSHLSLHLPDPENSSYHDSSYGCVYHQPLHSPLPLSPSSNQHLISYSNSDVVSDSVGEPNTTTASSCERRLLTSYYPDSSYVNTSHHPLYSSGYSTESDHNLNTFSLTYFGPQEEQTLAPSHYSNEDTQDLSSVHFNPS